MHFFLLHIFTWIDPRMRTPASLPSCPLLRWTDVIFSFGMILDIRCFCCLIYLWLVAKPPNVSYIRCLCCVLWIFGLYAMYFLWGPWIFGIFAKLSSKRCKIGVNWLQKWNLRPKLHKDQYKTQNRKIWIFGVFVV